jgi:hypothetical protein
MKDENCVWGAGLEVKPCPLQMAVYKKNTEEVGINMLV